MLLPLERHEMPSPLDTCSKCQEVLDEFDDCPICSIAIDTTEIRRNAIESPELTAFDRIIWNRLIRQEKG